MFEIFSAVRVFSTPKYILIFRNEIFANGYLNKYQKLKFTLKFFKMKNERVRVVLGMKLTILKF